MTRLKVVVAVIATVSVLLINQNTHAHGGGLDKQGCHKEKATRTRHCH